MLQQQLARAIQAGVLHMSFEENCGIASNWLPVVTKALHAASQNQDDKLIVQMANRCMPSSMQDCTIMEMLLCSIDPKHQMNADQDTLLQLEQMLSSEKSGIPSILDSIILNSTYSELAKTVKQNIQELITGKLGKKKPRGRERANCTWNQKVGRWVENGETPMGNDTGTTTPPTGASTKRTLEEAFASDYPSPPDSVRKTTKTVYDMDTGTYVSISDDEDEAPPDACADVKDETKGGVANDLGVLAHAASSKVVEI